jgi:hemerythrin superfamily protein
MNAIELLRQQHSATKEALEEMVSTEVLEPSEVRLLADELVAHMLIEEQIFYPRVKELAPDLVPEAFEEHAVARFALARLLIAQEPEQKIARLAVLQELVETHIEEEEESLFPALEGRIAAPELEQLGVMMEELFDRAVEAGLEALVLPDTQELRAFLDEQSPANKGTGARRARAMRT